jgi:hypothetical protein
MRVVIVWLVLGSGCWPKSAAPATSAGTPTVTASNCPAKGPLAPGRCRSNADCKGDWMECSPVAPKPRARATGMGKLFGTDDQECRADPRSAPPCPAGEAANPYELPNLCPAWECKPACTPASCGRDQYCDRHQLYC